MPINLDSCITGIFVPGNIGASAGQVPVAPTVPSFSVGNYGVGTARGVGSALGDTFRRAAGSAAGTGAAAAVGAVVASPPLDAYTTGLTGAWSMHRQLLTSYGGAFNANTGGLVGTINDQSGGSRNFTAAGVSRPALSTLGSLTSATFNSTGWPSMTISSALSNFITASAGYWVWVGSIDALPASFCRLFHNLTSETVGLLILSTNIASAYTDDGGNKQATTALGGTGKHVITWRHESGTLYVSVDGGTEASIAAGNTSAVTGNMELSNSSTGNNAFDGKFVELYVWSTVPSSGSRTAIIAQAKTLLGI